MSQDDPYIRTLERAFTAGDGPVAGDDCPSAEALWEARAGEGSPEARRFTIEHLAFCAACAAEWALIGREEACAAGFDVAGSPRRPRRWPLLLAAAAVLVAAVVVGRVRVGPAAPPPAVERSVDALEIRSLLADGATLPREGAVLRWTDLGPGTHYTVDVAAEDLTMLATARGLSGPEFTLPAGALAKAAAGGTVVWRVEAVLADGRRVASQGFRARVE